tara:strand:- start:467 stop:652 length:186 start_codon:yes stop_codon:yes gene_type:complete
MLADDLLDDELMDVLFSVKEKSDRTVALTFITGAGEKATLVITRDAACDLGTELADLGLKN